MRQPFAHVNYLVVEGIIRPRIQCVYTIRKTLVEFIENNGPNYRYYDLKLVVEILKNPTAVFENLKRMGEEKSVCVVGRPKHRYLNDGTKVLFPKRFVFLVFADANRFVTGWRMERADKKNVQLPENHADRFGRNLWKPLD